MLHLYNKAKLLFVWPLVACLALVAQNRGILKITVVEGDGAFNDIKKKTAHDAVVEVRDENNRLVPDARVVFSAPSAGPGGSFENGQKTYIATTDAMGRAKSRGFKPNTSEGRFQIKVTASDDGRTGSTVISQSNTLAGGTGFEPNKSHKTRYILVGVLGGAAVGGVVAATHGGGTAAVASPPVPTTISTGTITVGGPR